MFAFASVLILVVTQVKTVSSSDSDNGLESAYIKLQVDVTAFNNTEMKQLNEAMLNNDKLKPYADKIIQGLYLMYKPFLHKFNDEDGRRNMISRAKWFFHEDKKFVNDRITPDIGDDKKLDEIKGKVVEKLKEFQSRAISIEKLYGSVNFIEPLFEFTKTQSFLNDIIKMLNLPSNYFGDIGSIVMDILV